MVGSLTGLRPNGSPRNSPCDDDRTNNALGNLVPLCKWASRRVTNGAEFELAPRACQAGRRFWGLAHEQRTTSAQSSG